MSRFARVRAPGTWTGTLLPTEMAALDQRQFHAITKRGGAWATHDSGVGGSNYIQIGGAQGIEITGPSRLDKLIGFAFDASTQIQYAPRRLTRELSLLNAGGPHWRVGPSPQVFRSIRYELATPLLYQTTVPTPSFTVPPVALVTLPIPVGATLKGFRVKLRGNHNPNDPLPEVMPAIRLQRADANGAQASAPSLAQDASATTEAYNEDHEIVVDTITGSATNDGSRTWSIEVHGESGEDSRPGLIVWSVQATVEMSVHDEWMT